MKVIVVGGGASGLVSAIFAAKNNNDVLILDNNSICGKKILMTGNGKCNYWNSDWNIKHYHSNNIEILEKLITNENEEKVLNFFDSIGIIPKIKNGYYYPYSNQATTIETALIKEAELNNVKIKNNTCVLDIYKNGERYIVKTIDNEYSADNVILALGSKASIKGVYNGYDLVKKLGHNIIKPLPALVQLHGVGNYFKEWSGVRQDVKVSLVENGNLIRDEIGEIVLTDYGISGICVMQLSGMVSRGLDLKKEEKVIINFAHWITDNIDDFIRWLNERNKKVIGRTITELLDGILNYKLVNLLIKKSKIKPNMQWNEIDINLKKELAKNIILFEVKIIATNSFDKAQVCTGGVPLTEINIETMESNKNKGLYIIGELLDVDGDCGGYNLGFAWLSGMIAGNSIKKDGYNA